LPERPLSAPKLTSSHNGDQTEVRPKTIPKKQ